MTPYRRKEILALFRRVKDHIQELTDEEIIAMVAEKRQPFKLRYDNENQRDEHRNHG